MQGHGTTTNPVAWLMEHPEYGESCYSLRGAELAWYERRQRGTGRLIGYVLDMSQFHALNHEIGRTAVNERVKTWLGTLRHNDIVAGGGDEFCLVLDQAHERGFFARISRTLHEAGLYGYVTRVALDPSRSLADQMAAALDTIHAAKEADQPPRWQFWRLDDRARRYRLGKTKLVGGRHAVA